MAAPRKYPDELRERAIRLAVVGDAGHSGGGMTSVMIEYLDRVADSR